MEEMAAVGEYLFDLGKQEIVVQKEQRVDRLQVQSQQ